MDIYRCLHDISLISEVHFRHYNCKLMQQTHLIYIYIYVLANYH